ncbi:putative metallopeptidase [Blastopirellula marina]|nr:putative metallopeptidase [Blastopirellula marina]
MRQATIRSRAFSLVKRNPQPGFDFSWSMRQLVADMIVRTPELQHIDLSRMAVAVAQARKDVPYGIFASLTPLRFEGGSPTTTRRGRTYRVQRLADERGREMLYILTFYLPRFMDLDFQEKLITIFHELWHVSPKFDGDIRRLPGRCYAHSHSQKEYDEQMGVLANKYLMTAPLRNLYQFLELNFAQLHQQFGRVYGIKIPRPKMELVEKAPPKSKTTKTRRRKTG